MTHYDLKTFPPRTSFDIEEVKTGVASDPIGWMDFIIERSIYPYDVRSYDPNSTDIQANCWFVINKDNCLIAANSVALRYVFFLCKKNSFTPK